jgi:hypothetical protein
VAGGDDAIRSYLFFAQLASFLKFDFNLKVIFEELGNSAAEFILAKLRFQSKSFDEIFFRTQSKIK